jgi:hypothetical protein
MNRRAVAEKSITKREFPPIRPANAPPVKKVQQEPVPVVEEKPPAKLKMRKIITSEVRFEFVIPDGLPKDSANQYMWGKLQIICRNLSKNGLRVTPLVPREYVTQV